MILKIIFKMFLSCNHRCMVILGIASVACSSLCCHIISSAIGSSELLTGIIVCRQIQLKIDYYRYHPSLTMICWFIFMKNFRNLGLYLNEAAETEFSFLLKCKYGTSLVAFYMFCEQSRAMELYMHCTESSLLFQYC